MLLTVVRAYSFPLPFFVYTLRVTTHSKVEAFGDTQVTLSDSLEHPEQVSSAQWKGTQCKGNELLVGAPLATRKVILSINSRLIPSFNKLSYHSSTQLMPALT